MSNTNKGYFHICPIEGLDYKTQTLSGRTDEDGAFCYKDGETVTFSAGKLVLGSCPAEEDLTPADLSIEVTGYASRIHNRKVTNIARLLMSLGPDYEEKIEITDEKREILNKYAKRIYLNQPEDFFTADEQVKALMEELGSKLVSPAIARNYLRRAIAGVIKKTDVKIPVRSGGYVLADIFRPAKEGRYPVLISFGGYGKAFWLGKETNDEEREYHAKLEDDYFTGIPKETDYISFHVASLATGQIDSDIPGLPPKGSVMNPYMTHISEYFERANVMDWVPEGYVVMFVDSKGLGNVPGEYMQFGRPEADDYYDAIEWAGAQEWSNGNVGTYGGSFYAMNAFNVMSLCPPSLKACIPVCGDMDPYRDIMRFGGLSNKFGFTPKICAGEWKGIVLPEYDAQTPFDSEEAYNEFSLVAMKNDPAKIRIPFYTAISLEQAFIHTRGTSEIFINCSTPEEDKFMDISSEVGVHYWMYGKDVFRKHKAFFDHYLKGEETEISQTPQVHMMVRSGYGSYYWQDENEWPIARTEYRKYYFQSGDGFSGKLVEEAPAEDGCVTYAADGTDEIRFVSDPLEEDLVLAGYSMSDMFVSSTSSDMKVMTSLYALDEEGDRVPYILDLNPAIPISKGGLKISHRKEDEVKSTIYRPFHTHTKEDYMPLMPGEVVEAKVEMVPCTALIRKGWRIEFVVQANNPFSELTDLDDDYSEGASNSIYTGGSRPSYLQLPIIG